MSPQRARTYWWLFLAMSASVCVNLLLFQPRSDSRRSLSADARLMRMTAGPAPRQAEQIADTVRAIQRELKELNLYPGQVDGKPSPLLHAAILCYEQAQALPLTGEPTQALLRDLILGPPTGAAKATPQAGGGVVPGSAADRIVRDVRHKLNALGYAAGPSDGRLTLELMQAIRAFERDNGAPQAGRITANLLLQLQRSATAFRPRAG
jgi:peptidoglycan hydrolase-like protein with peptidoglycan-binding domain